MRYHGFSAAVLAAALVTAAVAPAAQASPTPAVTVTVDASGRVGTGIPDDFIGLSFEAEMLHEPWVSAGHGDLARLLNNLGHGSLRFAANGADTTAWQPNLSVPPPSWASGQVVTPADLARAGGLARRSGWPIDLGVNLLHDDPAAAAGEATAAQRELGSMLRTIQLGNEPNMYQLVLKVPNYAPDAYVKEAAAYRAAIGKSVPGVQFSGPDTAGFLWGIAQAGPVTSQIPSWWSAYLNAFGHQTRFLDQHYYPLVNTPEVQPPATMANLVSTATAANTRNFVDKFVQQARTAGLEAHLSETNNIANGGKSGVSNTLGAALWTVDYMLTAAQEGVTGMNFHQQPHDCGSYAWICLPDQAATTAGQLRAQPSYYAGLLVSALSGGRFLPARVSGTSADVTAYALRMPDGKIRVVVDDLDGSLKGTVAVRITGETPHEAEVIQLDGPSLESTSGVRFAGAQVGADGNFTPGVPRRISAAGDAFDLEMDTPSAVLMTVGDR